MAAGIMSNSAKGLILAYDFTSNGISKGVVVNQAQPSVANLNNSALYNAKNVRALVTKEGTRYGQNNSVNQDDSRAQLTYSTTLLSIWTVVCRVKFITTPIYDTSYICSDVYGRLIGFYIPYYGGKLSFQSLSNRYNFNFTPLLKTFYNLVIVGNGTTLSLYVNGLFNSSVIPDDARFAVSTIGYSNGSGLRCLNGVITDFRFFNRAITPQEVKDYNNYWAKKIILKENFSLYKVGNIRS